MAQLDSAGEFERLHVRPRAGRTLIVGSRVYPGRQDRRALYADVIGVDMLEGDGVDVVADLCDPGLDLGGFDHIECISVLEHCRRPWVLAENLQAMLFEGGTLHLGVPFIHRPHAYPSDFYRFTAEALPELFPLIEWETVLYGGEALWAPGSKVPSMKSESGYPYHCRCDVLGFGTLRKR